MILYWYSISIVKAKVACKSDKVHKVCTSDFNEFELERKRKLCMLQNFLGWIWILSWAMTTKNKCFFVCFFSCGLIQTLEDLYSSMVILCWAVSHHERRSCLKSSVMVADLSPCITSAYICTHKPYWSNVCGSNILRCCISLETRNVFVIWMFGGGGGCIKIQF